MAQPLGMPNDVAVYLGFINQMMNFPGQVFNVSLQPSNWSLLCHAVIEGNQSCVFLW
jgi:hypothetical protein